MLTVCAIVKENRPLISLGRETDSVVGASVLALVAERAFGVVVDNTALELMYLGSRRMWNNAHTYVLDCTTEPAAAVTFDMRKIDEEIAVDSLTAEVGIVEPLEPDLLSVKIFPGAVEGGCDIAADDPGMYPLMKPSLTLLSTAAILAAPALFNSSTSALTKTGWMVE